MDIKDLAVKYLAAGMKTEKQVRDYLERKEYSNKEIEQTIESLKEWNYLDDVEYAKVAFRLEYAKGRAKFRTIHYLKQKGISPENIDKGYGEFILSDDGKDIDENEIAVKVAKNMSLNRELDEKLKSKIARNLSARGFTTNTIYHAINSLD